MRDASLQLRHRQCFWHSDNDLSLHWPIHARHPGLLFRLIDLLDIRKRLLYRAFRELGRVERTLFLLRFVSNTEVHRVIRAETTKIEASSKFLD